MGEQRTRSWTVVAQQISARLNEPASLTAKGSLTDVCQQMTDAFGFSVTADHDALGQVGVDAKQLQLEGRFENLPIRSILHRLLHPHRLTSVVRSEGLAILPDYAQWLRDGHPAQQWIDPPPVVIEPLLDSLKQKVSVSFDEEPLSKAIQQIASELKVPIRIDKSALDSIGLTADFPVTVEAKEVSGLSVLQLVLRDLDCVLTVRKEGIEVTTTETAETEPLIRVYFLEGTGLPRNDYQGAISYIMLFVEPGRWSNSSVPIELAPTSNGVGERPALTIRITFEKHLRIETLLRGLRAISVGADGDSEPDFGIFLEREGDALKDPDKESGQDGGKKSECFPGD